MSSSFTLIPGNVSVGYPVPLRWPFNEAVVNLTLWSQDSDYAYSIADNITGGSYTWTPSTSLADGSYELDLYAGNMTPIYSEDVMIDHNKHDSNTSISSTITTSSTSAASSTIGPSSLSDSITATPTLTSSPPSASNISEPANIQKISIQHHTISNGGIAGIVVGAVLFIILTLAATILCWRRRRASQNTIPELPSHQTDADMKSDPSGTIWVPELGQEGAVYGPHELPGTPPPLMDDALEETTGSKHDGERRAVEMG